MSSEIYNQNYGRSIYNLRLNSLTFSATQNKIWKSAEADSFEQSSIEGIPIETKAKIFSNELIRLVGKKQASTAKIDAALRKYLPNIKVQLISMEDYDEFGINTKKNVSAATRPLYDEEGKLLGLKIYIPEIEYGNKLSENKYIENLTHEITHAMQFAEDEEVHLNRKKTPEGQFYNFYQQNVSNMLINTLVPQTLVELAKKNKIEMMSLEDYDKYLEAPSEEISDKEIKSLYEKHGSFERYINAGFEVSLENLMQKMQVENDVIAKKIINEAGGLDAFKVKVKQMVIHSLRMEEEAYKAGCQARKSARGFSGRDYNDAIPHLIGLVADALCSKL